MEIGVGLDPCGSIPAEDILCFYDLVEKKKKEKQQRTTVIITW